MAYLSIREFCRRVGRAFPTIAKHIAVGNVKTVKYNKPTIGIHPSEVQKFLKRYGKK